MRIGIYDLTVYTALQLPRARALWGNTDESAWTLVPGAGLPAVVRVDCALWSFLIKAKARLLVCGCSSVGAAWRYSFSARLIQRSFRCVHGAAQRRLHYIASAPYLLGEPLDARDSSACETILAVRHALIEDDKRSQLHGSSRRGVLFLRDLSLRDVRERAVPHVRRREDLCTTHGV